MGGNALFLLFLFSPTGVAADDPCRFRAEASQYLSEASLTNGGLKKFTDALKNQGVEVSDAVCCLPDSYRDNYVIVYESKSVQHATPGQPRVIFFDPTANPETPLRRAFSINGGHRIEMIEFDRPGDFRGRNPNPSSFSTIGLKGTDSYHHTNGLGEQVCLGCHRNGGAIFDSVPDWNGVLGGKLDEHGMARELEAIRQFRANLKDPEKGKNYRCLKDIDKKLDCLERTNSISLSQIQAAERSATKIASDGQLYRESNSCEQKLFAASNLPRVEICRDVANSDLRNTNFAFTGRLATLGIERMLDCVKREVDPAHFAALQGAVACQGAGLHHFFPDCAKISDASMRNRCEQLLPAPPSLERVIPSVKQEGCVASTIVTRFNEAAVNTFQRFESVLQRSNGTSCLDTLLVSRNRAEKDPFASVPLPGISKKISEAFMASAPAPLRGALAPMRNFSRKLGEVGTPADCAELARHSRNTYLKKLGLPQEGAATNAGPKKALEKEMLAFQKKIEEIQQERAAALSKILGGKKAPPPMGAPVQTSVSPAQ